MNSFSTRLIAVSVVALALAGCPSPTKPDPLPEAPGISSFTASPTLVKRGEPTTLTWSTSNAPKVTIADSSKGDVSGVDNKATGSLDVTITDDTLFVLSAVNDRGVRATSVATVRLDGAKGNVLFTAVPQVLGATGSGTLAWSAPGANTVTITDDAGATVDLKGQTESGSVEVNPTAAETRYTLTADGVTREVTLSRAQAITEFTASKTLAKPGEMITFGWKTTNATKVTLSGPGRPNLVSSSEAATVSMGSYVETVPTIADGAVLPYVLRVEGKGEAIEQVVSIYVGQAPVITDFTAPPYAKTGGTFDVTWRTVGASAVQILAGTQVVYEVDEPTRFAAGTAKLSTPAASTVYTLKVSAGSGESVLKTATVAPIGATAIGTFTATPGTIAAGGAAVDLAWNVPNARKVRIVADGEVTVFTGRGPSVENGTTTVYPNKAASNYVLYADNTLDPATSADAGVTVTAPEPLSIAGGGLAFEGGTLDLTWAAGAGAQIYGLPHGEVVTNSASTGFTDISTTGTRLTFSSADDATARFDLADFETFIVGTRVGASVVVSTNGFMVFGTTASTRPTNSPLPNATVERNFVAPFWDDLTFGGTSAVHWQLIGEAPERELVVQWSHVARKNTAGSDLTFQARVHQTGVVRFEYQTMTTTSVSQVIGVQGVGDGFASGGGVSNSSLTFFGPKAAPANLAFRPSVQVGGFVKLMNGYLKLSLTPGQVVRANDLSITEVMYEPAAAIASTGEWFEVVNRAAFPINLVGVTIDFGGGSTHTIAGAGGTTVVPSDGGVLVLGQSAPGAANDNVATGYVYGPTFAMPQPAGTVALTKSGYRVQASWAAGAGGNGASLNVDLGSPGLIGTGGFACASTTTFGSQTPLQRGSPGANAGCYALSTIPVAFEDISATGVALVSSNSGDPDEDVFDVPLTTPFPYMGASQALMTVSTNGWVAFNSPTGSTFTNKTTPGTGLPVGTIAPFWDDLDVNLAGTGDIYYGRVGDHAIVQWKSYSHYFYDDNLNFEVKLFDSGRIEFHYQTMVSDPTSGSNYATGSSATVWLENLTGTAARAASINQPNIAPNTAYRFQ